tara:strand:+ start:83 stop:676 length:594 start_codon:yes stop_codon:yes gene_type:complete
MDEETTLTTRMNDGHIHIILGCMYSGKSTELQRIIRRMDVIQSKYLVINHSIDTRYNKQGGIVTHNQTKIPCMTTYALMKVINNKDFKEANSILIEEAQFFPDLFEFATLCADQYKKEVIVVGLSGDYKREPFGDICKLIPHAEKITKLNALCILCKDGTLGHFSKKNFHKNTSSQQIDVGSTDKYIAVCRKHYNLS